VKRKPWSSSFFLLQFIFFAPRAFAGLESSALEASKEVSKAVQYTAEQIDLTLAGERYTDHANESQISVSQLVTWTEGGVFKQSTDLGVNLRLPNVEKHWQLRFSTYDEEQEQRDMSQRRVRTTPRDREYGTSLFFLQKLGNVKVTFQPKLQLRNPLEMSYVLSFESSAEENKGERYFRVQPKFQLYADAIKGTGEYFSLNFIYRLRKTMEVALENEEEYREKDLHFTTRHGVTYDYILDKKNKIRTALIASSSNHDFHLDEWDYNVSYGHELYKKLLNMTVSPFWNFARGDHFKGKVGISFNLIASF